MVDSQGNENAGRFLRIISTRRFWFLLFVTIYGTIVCSIRKTVRSALKWQANMHQDEHLAVGWSALYASVLFGTAFGVLAMVAVLAVALPAMLLTWTTILVMLAFAGKHRDLLVFEGKRITRDIASFVFKIMLKEGNTVAASCAFFSFFLFIHREE